MNDLERNLTRDQRHNLPELVRRRALSHAEAIKRFKETISTTILLPWNDLSSWPSVLSIVNENGTVPIKWENKGTQKDEMPILAVLLTYRHDTGIFGVRTLIKKLQEDQLARVCTQLGCTSLA